MTELLDILQSSSVDLIHNVDTPNLMGHSPSKRLIGNCIACPLTNKLYSLTDGSGAKFLIVYDGQGYWYSRMNKAR